MINHQARGPGEAGGASSQPCADTLKVKNRNKLSKGHQCASQKRFTHAHFFNKYPTGIPPSPPLRRIHAAPAPRAPYTFFPPGKRNHISPGIASPRRPQRSIYSRSANTPELQSIMRGGPLSPVYGRFRPNTQTSRKPLIGPPERSERR